MDCMNYLKTCADYSFDLAVVDPPYGIGEDGSSTASRSRIGFPKDYKSFAGADLEPPNAEYFSELKRVSRHQIIWGANHFADRLQAQSPCWIVWDKENGASDFADCELAYTSFTSAVRKFNFRWAGMLQGDMKNKEHRIHPTQKPVKLYDWIYSTYAQQSWRVLDTHLGSGSSAISAHYYGCDFVGIELDEHYFKLAQDRFDLETRQTSLFAPVGESQHDIKEQS